MAKQDAKVKKMTIDPQLKFQLTEAYKTIRTNIMFSISKKGSKAIVITSTEANEGKSTGAVNIAISLAQTNTRVLLIDTDLRKSKVHMFFDMSAAPGLTHAISGIHSLEEVVRHTAYSNLDVITSGATPPNPSELLASDAFFELVEQLKQQYDYIIIDTPPINVVSDALPVCKMSDGVVLMIRSCRTTYGDLDKTLSSLSLVDAKVLGIILNSVDVRKKTYGRYGYRKYGSGYGYGYGYSKNNSAD